MTRQAFTRILLSLLLLITQQMAASHAMSHWGAMLGQGSAHAQGQSQNASRAHQPDGGESELSRAFALDQTCDQCLAFAQLAAPLGNTTRFFAAPDLAAQAIACAVDQTVCARTVCAFRSRAPPQA